MNVRLGIASGLVVVGDLIGAGAASGGTLDASNLLKPALSNGQLKCIGATTYTEFRGVFEKDPSQLGYFRDMWIRFFEAMGRMCYDAADRIVIDYFIQGTEPTQECDGTLMGPTTTDSTFLLPGAVAGDPQHPREFEREGAVW